MQVWLAGEIIVRCEHQGLSTLPPQLWLKAALRKLLLTGNALTCLPQDIQRLKELRELHVGHNQLVQLPEEVCLLSQLQYLDAQHNQLTTVPAALCRCVSAVYHPPSLYMGCNCNPSAQCVTASAAYCEGASWASCKHLRAKHAVALVCGCCLCAGWCTFQSSTWMGIRWSLCCWSCGAVQQQPIAVNQYFQAGRQQLQQQAE